MRGEFGVNFVSRGMRILLRSSLTAGSAAPLPPLISLNRLLSSTLLYHRRIEAARKSPMKTSHPNLLPLDPTTSLNLNMSQQFLSRPPLRNPMHPRRPRPQDPD